MPIDVKLYDGTTLRFPDGTQPDVIDRAAKTETASRKKAAYVASALDRPSTTAGLAESALTLGSSALATPVAGLAGLATGAANLAGVDTNMSPSDVVRSVQERFTYQPRTEGGKLAVSAISYPFEKLAQGADWVGQSAADATGSPLVGAAVNTGVQSLPALFLRGRSQPAQTAGTKGGATAGTAANAAQAAEIRAREFATRSAGLDWNSLPVQIKTQLTEIAQDAKRLDSLDPAAVQRQARLAALDVPVPATRGQITRDPVAMRNEANVAATNAGAPIRNIYDQANRALIENLDVLKGRVGRGSAARTPEDVGRSVQDSALRAKQAKARAQTKAAYDKARATEPDAETTAQPLYDLLDGSPEVTRLGWMESWLARAKITKSEKTGGGMHDPSGGIVVETQRGVKARELDDLRQRAVKIARAGGTDAVYASDVIKAIDASMEGIPASAKAWQAARAAHRAERAEFGDRGAVAKLVDNKPNSPDRRVALEDTASTIVSGSLDDIRTVKQSLLTGGDAATRAAGKRAWRDVRAQVIQRIRDEATKGVAPLADGSPNLTPAALKRAVDSIGPERLNEIFGPGTSQRLNRIVQAAQDVKTIPGVAVPVGSSTLQNALAFLERGLDKVPVVGGPIGDIARGAAQVRNIGANARSAKQATTTPLQETAQATTNALARRRTAQAVSRNALYQSPLTAPREQR